MKKGAQKTSTGGQAPVPVLSFEPRYAMLSPVAKDISLTPSQLLRKYEVPQKVRVVKGFFNAKVTHPVHVLRISSSPIPAPRLTNNQILVLITLSA